jgi:hypothetical protein
MAWINIEVDGTGDEVNDINNVRIMNDDNNDAAIFATAEEADLWCSQNANSGMTYWQLEIWGCQERLLRHGKD